jgi:hypothetical protein
MGHKKTAARGNRFFMSGKPLSLAATLNHSQMLNAQHHK